MGNKNKGDRGEEEVIKLIPCPNCGKRLMLLPPNYPLYDVQCTGCSFRAQIKTNQSRPKSIIFGAGWQIMEKVLRSGFIIPPLILNFKWKEKTINNQEIRFYPFIPKSNLKKYQLSEKARRAKYWMFTYVGLDKLPYFSLYKMNNQLGRAPRSDRGGRGFTCPERSRGKSHHPDSKRPQQGSL